MIVDNPKVITKLTPLTDFVTKASGEKVKQAYNDLMVELDKLADDYVELENRKQALNKNLKEIMEHLAFYSIEYAKNEFKEIKNQSYGMVKESNGTHHI